MAELISLRRGLAAVYRASPTARRTPMPISDGARTQSARNIPVPPAASSCRSSA